MTPEELEAAIRQHGLPGPAGPAMPVGVQVVQPLSAVHLLFLGAISLLGQSVRIGAYEKGNRMAPCMKITEAVRLASETLIEAELVVKTGKLKAAAEKAQAEAAAGVAE